MPIPRFLGKTGTAAADFRSLHVAWSHTGITTKTKLRYFDAIVTSKLLYGLSSVWLVTAQKRRLDGFYAKCMRSLLRIPSAYISRIANTRVLSHAGTRPLSEQLLLRQLLLMGKVARSPDGSTMRINTFRDGTVQPQIGRFIRRRGRPRQDWTNDLLKVGSTLVGKNRFE